MNNVAHLTAYLAYVFITLVVKNNVALSCPSMEPVPETFT